MKKDIKLKGQLKLYMQWPGIMILFLILMNIWIFRMDRKAGLLMSAFVLVYAVVIGIMYFYNKSLILADMVEFAAQYGIVQNTLLKELSIPYAILLDDGKIIWTNTQFREVLGTTIRKDTYLSKYIPELNRGVFPKEDNESVSRNSIILTEIIRLRSSAYRSKVSVRQSSFWRYRRKRNILLRYIFRM